MKSLEKENKKEIEKAVPLNILVVDDEKEICKLLAKYISIEGHRVKYVLTGKEAIQRIKSENFDVVILDIIMPGISSMNVLSEIKKTSPNTEVVVITGKLLNMHIINELKQKGALGFFQKPFKIEKIMEIIKGIVNN